jgi:hypothetical protein
MIFSVVEVVVAVLFIWFLWTQLLVPTFFGRPKFPFFRKTAPEKVDSEMTSLREESAVLDRTVEKEKLRQIVKDKRSKINPPNSKI